MYLVPFLSYSKLFVKIRLFQPTPVGGDPTWVLPESMASKN